VLYRDDSGLVEPHTGQRFLPFAGEGRGDSPDAGPEGSSTVRTALDRRHESDETDAGSVADDAEPSIVRLEPVVRAIPADGEAAFAEGERRLAEDDAVGAIAAFRHCLRLGSREALVQFRLAEALYRTGEVEAARERYFAAVECDGEFLEGWTQLGCVLAETGDAEGACAAFGTALALHPDHAEAHFHLAEVHHGAGRTDAAATHWRRYLEFDQVGPWAQHVRDRLERCSAPTEPTKR
jgi:cytochrome c-type biogenesis protein CcmH/NrfG